MTEKRFWALNTLTKCSGIKDKDKLLTFDEVVDLLNELYNENERLKKGRFICLDCEHSGYVEIGCLCEYTDNWQDYIKECEDFKELRE